MAGIKTIDKQILENLFQMEGGYVLNFSDRTMGEFFDDDLSIPIYDEKYNYASGSKANRMRGFWRKADNKTVGRSILKLIEYIESQILIGNLKNDDFPENKINAGKQIGRKLFGGVKDEITTEAEIVDGKINIVLQKDVFSHVQDLLQNGHYFNAVEEAYKIVRYKLRDITGKEKAHEAFKSANYPVIFGHAAKDAVEADFFEGVKFLHMAIQKLRNEKAHTPAHKIDKNLAIHYIVLASLSYDLIDKN